MATNSRLDLQATFVDMLTIFKKLSPAIHKRLQNPQKIFGSFGSPSGTGKKNEFGYAMNVGDSSTIDNLKKSYMALNVILNEKGYSEYIIDDIKPLLPDFKTKAAVQINNITQFVDKRIPYLEPAGVMLTKNTFYVSHAMEMMMYNFPILEKCPYERLVTLAKGTTKEEKSGIICYDIEKLREYSTLYDSILIKPHRGINEIISNFKKIKVPTGNTRSKVEELEQRLAELRRRGGKHRKNRITKKRSIHKKRTHKRKH